MSPQHHLPQGHAITGSLLALMGNASTMDTGVMDEITAETEVMREDAVSVKDVGSFPSYCSMF